MRELQLYIPTIGDRLTLTEDWQTTINGESRNQKFIEALGFSIPNLTFNRSSLTRGDLLKLGFSEEQVNNLTPDKSVYGPKPESFETDKNQIYWDAEETLIFSLTEMYRHYAVSYTFTCEVTIPQDTILRVDRIYIRKGKGDFDSITFVVESGLMRKKRFWVPLKTVNTMHCLVDD